LGHRLLYNPTTGEVSIKMDVVLGTGGSKTEVKNGVYLQFDKQGKPQKILQAAIGVLLLEWKKEAWEQEKKMTHEAQSATAAEFVSSTEYTSVKEGEEVTKVRIIAPLYSAGSLSHLLKKTELNTEQKVFIVKTLLQGMKDLHKKNIIHHDLKPDNVFVEGNKELEKSHKKEYFPKIADFGESFKIQADALGNVTFSSSSTVVHATTAFCSPDKDELKTVEDCLKADEWGCAMTSAEIVGAWEGIEKIPWFEAAVARFSSADGRKAGVETWYKGVAKPIGTKDERAHLKKEELLQQIVYRMLDPNPETRFSVDKALKWIEKYVETSGTQRAVH